MAMASPQRATKPEPKPHEQHNNQHTTINTKLHNRDMAMLCISKNRHNKQQHWHRVATVNNMIIVGQHQRQNDCPICTVSHSISTSTY